MATSSADVERTLPPYTSSASGPVPPDEFVESIPIRETRHYVKRVLGTYQLYRVLYDEGPVFPDWRHTAASVGG